uniref:Eukaryotic translation initiation factor 4 gamma 3 n=3 Tax=Lygus hesperus TaxID=30085 RepID=A0A0K8SEI4_LYGHE
MEENEEVVTPVSVTFRKLLLNKCQEGFEKINKYELDIANRTKEIEETPDPEKKKELKLLLDEDERKVRRKSVGLVRFIGELYKLHMLTPKIMHGCISTLLSQVAEEPLECLCKLLTTIGKELEHESGKREFDEYFATMHKLAQKNNESRVSSRIRFMLQDVIELRQKNWKPRRDENNPKTIEQIHKDAERDAAIESAMLSAPMHQSNKGRHPGDGRRNQRSNQDSDGWQTSGNKYRTSSSSYTNTVEPSKLQHFKSDAGDAGISLGGSGAFSQWTSGASTKRAGGGGLMDSSRSGPPPSNNMTTNRFALLGQADSSDSRLKYSSSMGGKGKGVSGSNSLEKDSRNLGGMMRDRDREDMRRMGSGPSSRENSRPRYAQSGHSPAGSLNSRMDRDFSRSEQPSSRGGYQDNREATEARVPPASTSDLDEEEGKRKANTIFDEWCANNNAEETLSTVSDTFVGPNNMRLLVRSILNKVIEGKPHTRTKFADLLVVILQEKKVITKKDVIAEFQTLIEIGDDMVVDIPFFWSIFGQIFAPLITNEVISIDDLRAALDERPLNDRAKVVAEVFKSLNVNEKTSIWTSSNAKLTEFVPEKEIDNFVKSNNFWFLTGNAEPAVDWRKHRDNLAKILQGDSDKAMDEAHAFLAKIEGSVSKKAFIEIVTMAVIKASLKDGKLVGRQINKFDKLILKYVDNTEDLELICLFAIKNFVVKEAALELSVLTESFRNLYDDSIISVEAFKKWKDDTSIEPLESEGRLLATKTLEPFYVFLAEADDEEEES